MIGFFENRYLLAVKQRSTICACVLALLCFHTLIGQTFQKGEVLALIRGADSLLYDQPVVSLDLAEEALSKSRELADDSLIATSLNRLGSAHWSLGNQVRALKSLRQSRELAERRGLEHLIAKNEGNLGNIYAASGLDLDAILHYKKERMLQTQLRDSFRMFAIHNNIGKAFNDLKFYDSAKHYLYQAYEYLDSSFVHLHAIFYFNLAEAHLFSRQEFKADSFLTMAFENAKLYNSTRGKIRCNQLRAEILLLENAPGEALQFALQAGVEAKKTQVKELIYICYKTISKAYAANQEFEKAYEYERLHEAYRDSVISVQSVNELELLSFNERQARIKSLEDESQLNAELARQRQVIIYGLIFIVFLLATMIIAGVFLMRKLRTQKVSLQELNNFKTRIFAIVSHDLRSPIQSVSSLVDLLNSKLMKEEDVKMLLPEVQEKTANLTQLLNSILIWAGGQIEDEALTVTDVSLDSIMAQLHFELQEKLTGKHITLDWPEDDMKLKSNEGVVRIVLRNLIVNAIKYSHEGGRIQVSYFSGQKEKVVSVEDEGVGMPAAVRQTLFSASQSSTTGTKGEKGNGLGLLLCFDLMKRLGGHIDVESEVGKGTVFFLKFKER